MANTEAAAGFDGGVLDIDAADLGKAWAFPQHSFELRDLRGIAGRIYLDGTIVEIAHPAGYADALSGMFDEVAEAHALDATAHYVSAGNGFTGTHIKFEFGRI